MFTPDMPRRPDVTADDFFALDIRAGRVVEVQDFPEARKPSYKMSVDFGPAVGVLTTSAQATHYSKEDLVGRMVVAAINLGERRIAGFKSQFLVLGTFDSDGRVRLLQPEEGAEPGSPVA